MEHQVREILFDSEEQTKYGEIPENLEEHIQWLEGFFNKVPEELRHSAFVETGASSYYDCGVLEYKVGYVRPETPAEATIRLGKISRQEAQVRESEIRQLKRLREKYGDV